MKVKLRIVGNHVDAPEVILSTPAVIGRSSTATLALPHPLISRQHCELFESDGALMVRDLGSLNGTYVGNERVTESVLPSGELLTIATVNFRVLGIEPSDIDELALPTGEETTEEHSRNPPEHPIPSMPRPHPDPPCSRTELEPNDAPSVRDTELQSGDLFPGNDGDDEFRLDRRRP